MEKNIFLNPNKNYAIKVKTKNDIKEFNIIFKNIFHISKPYWIYLNNNIPTKYSHFQKINKDEFRINPTYNYKDMNYEILTFKEYLTKLRPYKLKLFNI